METAEQLKKTLIEEFSSSASVDLYTKAATQGLWKSEESLIEKHFVPGASVLDIGCGTGRTTMALAALKYRVTGVDLTPKVIEIAKRFADQAQTEIDYRVGDCTNLELPDNAFDCALFSYNGWDNIPGEVNRVKALREIYRVLRPASPTNATAGYFIFSTHIWRFKNFKSLYVKQFFRIHILKRLGFPVSEIDIGDTMYRTSPSSDARVFVHYPKVSRVVRLLNEAGFELVEMRERHSFGAETKPFSDQYNFMMYVARKRRKE